MRLPNLDDDGYTIEDIEKLQVQNSWTNFIKPREEREGLKVGRFAKITVVVSTPDYEVGRTLTESFWVRVSSVNRQPELVYEGRIKNIPLCETMYLSDCLKYNQLIKFEPKHILDILSVGEDLYD
jgi:hypothetical protein